MLSPAFLHSFSSRLPVSQQNLSVFADKARSMKTRVICLLPALALLLSGCKSTSTSTSSTKSSRLASVVIRGHSVADVSSATHRVFTENGYQATAIKSGDLAFDKQGSSMNTLVYGDWSGKPVWIRVKVYLRDLGAANGILLDCDAFTVLERGDAHFEEERKMTKLRHGTYQDLLDKVGQRLQ